MAEAGRPPLARRLQAALKAAGLSPAASRGQHFLVREERLDDLAGWAELAPGRAALEIGPGLGTLTGRLLATGAELWAVEIDRGFFRFLEVELAGRPGLHLTHEDGVRFLRRELAGGALPARLVLASNLPYRITTPVILAAAARPERVPLQVLTIQLEVAERLAAPPGHPARSGLAALLEWRHRVEILARLAPEDFWPRPAVRSAIVRIRALAEPAFLAPDGYPGLIRAVFARRRKTLRNNLLAAGALAPGGASQVDAALARAGLDGRRRAEELAGAELARLGRELAGPDRPEES